MEQTYQTQCIDTGIDHYSHVPIPHKALAQAELYAKDLTARRVCEVRILDGRGKVVDLFRDGESVLNQAIDQAIGRGL